MYQAVGIRPPFRTTVAAVSPARQRPGQRTREGHHLGEGHVYVGVWNGQATETVQNHFGVAAKDTAVEESRHGGT